LDDERYRSQAAQSRARLDAAVANLELADAQYQLAQENLRRHENLFEQKLISVETLRQQETNAKVEQARRNAAEEDVRSLRASLAQAEKDLAETVFNAPIGGIVTSLNIEEGENVIPGTMNNPGTVILEIAELDTMEVEAEVDETDVVGMHDGQRARILVDAFDPEELSGEVTAVGQSGRATSSTQDTQFRVRVRIDDPPPALRPGMSADVEVLIGSADSALVVPIQALTAYPGSVVAEWQEDEAAGRTHDRKKGRRGPSKPKSEPESADRPASERSRTAGDDRLVEGIFLVESGAARFRAVELGLRSDTHVEIAGDVRPGQLVITGPYKILRDLQGGDLVDVEAPARQGRTP
ncbi:MAG: efflux RND transporter periplasmic adaptor subunit, partial [Candidatus Eisenbacteria bacterium]|nr:efflux RND transporter periplasmic adaptor subunit [Candidatus Eisenbacteria bacterium]